ncbi:MAG TPA: YdeI/OmpD-associated family protein [Candidatus Thermoplasmatota archaeon]
MTKPQPPLKPLVRARDASEWRAWLAKHHRTATEAWLVLHTKASGKRSVPYNDAVDEALCFGWIDSVVKPLGAGARAQRCSPRRRGSPVSEVNRARVRRLVREGRMTPAGLQALPGVDQWLDPPPLVVAKDIERRIRGDPRAWAHYQRLPEAYKRIRVGWIEGARSRPEEFERRLAHFIRKTARGERFGMVQG